MQFKKEIKSNPAEKKCIAPKNIIVKSNVKYNEVVVKYR